MGYLFLALFMFAVWSIVRWSPALKFSQDLKRDSPDSRSDAYADRKNVSQSVELWLDKHGGYDSSYGTPEDDGSMWFYSPSPVRLDGPSTINTHGATRWFSHSQTTDHMPDSDK